MRIYLTNDSGDLQLNFENYRKLINPCGMIVNFSGDNAPNGWLICDGSEISKITYASLFDVIGTKYGSASNSNNFKLPDLGERIPAGFKSGTNILGNTGGNSSITLTTSQIPSHTHTGTTISDGLHSHTINDPGHTHSQTTVNDDFNNSGGNIYPTNSNPSFAGYDTAETRTWNNISTDSTGISINLNGAHTHTFTTNSTGGGVSIDIRNKFIVLNYIIKY